MKSASNNPLENKLGAGISIDLVTEAVRKSGYPLQTVIANSLRTDFRVQEEWSFIDAESKELRTLDILATQRMYESAKGEHPRVRPDLTLLVECKQSDLPFVFFSSATRPWLKTFPFIAGLAQDRIAIKTNDDGSTWNFSLMEALGLRDKPFVTGDGVEICMSMSKCVRKGKELELSGTEAFQNLIRPMVKALRHFKSQEMPPVTAHYFDCHLALAVAVLDAPMVAAKYENDEGELSLVPWARVVRHEAVEGEHSLDRTETFAVDVVHKSFFNKYLHEHAIPFAQLFSELALKHQVEVATGRGFVRGMGKGGHLEIETKLKPR